MKVTIEIEDNLKEIVDGAKEEIQNLIKEYYEEHPEALEADETVDWDDLNYSGGIDEIIDGCTPIYTSTIKGLWYLYDSEFIEAYKQEGAGENPHEYYGATAIYYYIRQEVSEWYFNDDESICEEIRERMKEKNSEGESE